MIKEFHYIFFFLPLPRTNHVPIELLDRWIAYTIQKADYIVFCSCHFHPQFSPPHHRPPHLYLNTFQRDAQLLVFVSWPLYDKIVYKLHPPSIRPPFFFFFFSWEIWHCLLTITRNTDAIFDLPSNVCYHSPPIYFFFFICLVIYCFIIFFLIILLPFPVSMMLLLLLLYKIFKWYIC